MKKISFRLFILALFILSFLPIGQSVAAIKPEDLRFFAALEGPLDDIGPVRIELPHQVLSKSESRTADIRIFDERDREQPIIIYLQYQRKEMPASVHWEVMQYEMLPGQQVITLEREKYEEPCHTLTFSTSARDFRKSVQILESDGFLSWEPLVSSAIFDFSSHVKLRKTRVETPVITKRYLRVIISDSYHDLPEQTEINLRFKDLEFTVNRGQASELTFDGFSSLVGLPVEEVKHYDSIEIRRPAVHEDDERNTVVDFGNINIPVERITIIVSEHYFYRTINFVCRHDQNFDGKERVSSGEIFRLPDIGGENLSIDIQKDTCPYGRLYIVNLDNPPLEIESISLQWVRRNLYFIPQPGKTYRLFIGGRNVGMPRYDIHRLIADKSDVLMSYPSWRIGTMLSNPSYKPPTNFQAKERRERFILIIVISAVGLVLVLWLTTLLRKVPETPTPEATDEHKTP